MAAERHAAGLSCVSDAARDEILLSLLEAGKKSARSDDPSLCGRRMAAQRHADRLV
jgi:hypothetical protein